MNDEMYMQIALELAKKGTGKVNPNPLVGAVIVKNEEIIGKGYHEFYGGPHAERNALKNCKSSPKGATMYVTLEPCCHFGKTPPCTEAIIESGISKIVVGTVDPNDKVAGKGIERLKKAGINVKKGILEEECGRINQVFFHYITTQTPFVVMKYAMTIDGKIATVTGKSKWITCKKSRENVQRDRNKYAAIMVGIGTVLQDNPMLTCRLAYGRNPTRIVCDSYLRMPLNCNLVMTAKEVRTIIVTTIAEKTAHEPYIQNGCEIVVVSKKGNYIDLNQLMKQLGKMKIDSILLEGGSTLNFSALESKIVNKVQCYIAPKIFGGENAKSPVGGKGYSEVYECIRLKNTIIRPIEDELLLESEVDYFCSPESLRK